MNIPKLKCLVVDDSTLQRLSIIKLVKDHPRLELVAEHNNALDTKRELENSKIDLVFLDIEMPILSGFDLLDNLKVKPEIIFITGKTQYAFQAFNYQAIDYLQKPVSRERFNQAVEKAIDQYTLKNDKVNPVDENFIFIKSNLKKHRLYLDKVKYVEAFGDYVKIFTDTEVYTVLSTMKGFAETLPKEQFLRVHKSYIVNLFRIKNYSSKLVFLEDKKIPLSRNRKKDLEESLSGIA
ncbi:MULTISPECIES: LytR/AlgR family response regulator transcription factor [Mesonia]|uniref:Transcriptional regulatory protein YpdB n=1 Tax=Mesonia oceanica TaxID=2687242 RepID=A0AC61Y7B2_9FLAO|nr:MULTISPECIES: LytTR family DNA-binding domain-containing protein [Mesonia]MAN26839.1 DNA-binding response regulator [Mesonia sp.]MAQ40540.1 DNA-binding response regulator [Mesonia sp.]MBJ98229.1 DNA-binding response regulator [Flavobacteriaceae bacterium]VVV00382.1 Transcriptional regulatory protein YpdB [Mesonia oceanica]|tara:strand:+ start:654 stop:1364 length:711 start_codon:yes stop_codon:yes gene_type:complete